MGVAAIRICRIKQSLWGESADLDDVALAEKRLVDIHSLEPDGPALPRSSA